MEDSSSRAPRSMGHVRGAGGAAGRVSSAGTGRKEHEAAAGRRGAQPARRRLSRALGRGAVRLVAAGVLLTASPLPAAQRWERYFAHPAVHDEDGVIAPWYQGQNGQLDFRVRVAAETLKRYPWAERDAAVMAAPHFVFNGHWSIGPDGAIHVPSALPDWDNGDIGQRSYSLLAGMIRYYRYTGDPAAIGLVTLTADYLLDYCQTPPDHPWPGFLISCPTRGKAYGRADPHGFLQLDIVGMVGSELLRAYHLTGRTRYLEAALHWADLLAERCDTAPGRPPWPRYANPADVPFENRMTGGVVLVLQFFDDILRMGVRDPGGRLGQAREAGERYLRETLLPQWTEDPTFGHYFWDWNNPTATCSMPCFAAHYLMARPDAFPGWRRDVRNIVTLLFCRTGVAPASGGDAYSGAWAFPESSSCCGPSLQYPTMLVAFTMARYGHLTQNPWAREVARRQSLLMTYDATETGVVIDGIDGTVPVAGAWFNLAHPWPLLCALEALSWQPDLFGPSRENHILRTESVVRVVRYAKGRVEYQTAEAPAGGEDVLRLAFRPTAVRADGEALPLREPPAGEGFVLTALPDGDWLVVIRRGGRREVVVEGDDPQQYLEDSALAFEGPWSPADLAEASGGQLRVAEKAGAEVRIGFTGNQVRVIGRAEPGGGRADVYLDGVRQLCGIDAWCPDVRDRQVLWYRNGLPQGPHTLRIVTLGAKNPVSEGTRVSIDGVQWSAAQPATPPDYGAGGGPTEPQRMVFGYPGQDDLADSEGNLWRPGTEYVTRLGPGADCVARTWWPVPARGPIGRTRDPDLYRYGVHAPEFTVNLTVGPGVYDARLGFAASRGLDTHRHCVTVAINGEPVVTRMDVAATAGGPDQAVDLVFAGIRPRNGILEFRLTGGNPALGVAGEAFLQNLAVVPAEGRPAAGPVPVTVAYRNLLRNGGFEEWGEAPAGGQGPVNWRWEGRGTLRPASAAGDARPAETAEGREAARISGGGQSRLYQEVGVRPRSVYRASVMIRTGADADPVAGPNPAASGGIVLEELDAEGRLLAAHPKATLAEGTPLFRWLSVEITTGDATARLRFVLDTRDDSAPGQGWVTYDQAALDGPPGAATVAGRVLDERARQPVPGAVVSVEEQSVRSGADGTYALTGLADLMAVTVRTLKEGYYPETRRLELTAGENPCDLALTPLPTANLLRNGDFEEGFGSTRSFEHGLTGVRGAWSFRFAPGPASYFYPESIYEWRKPCICRGKESVGYVTDGGGEGTLWQDVAVEPHTRYVASAWVRGLDVEGTGQGFGAGPNDFAGIRILELDAQGRVLIEHEKAGIRSASPEFQRVRYVFVTGPGTAQVRFCLWATMACVWRRGAAIYDDCVLERERE